MKQQLLSEVPPPHAPRPTHVTGESAALTAPEARTAHRQRRIMHKDTPRQVRDWATPTSPWCVSKATRARRRPPVGDVYSTSASSQDSSMMRDRARCTACDKSDSQRDQVGVGMHVTALKAHNTEAALKMSCRKKGHERASQCDKAFNSVSLEGQSGQRTGGIVPHITRMCSTHTSENAP